MTLKIVNDWLSSQPQTWTVTCPQGTNLLNWQSTVKKQLNDQAIVHKSSSPY